MAITGKYTAPAHAHANAAAIMGPPTDGAKLSPRVELLKKLVASGQYQVSPRYLAYKIFEAAGVRADSE